MNITIAKQFTFDAAHSIPTMPEGHKCRRLHGHTYQVEIRLMGEPDENWILIDYGDIEKIWLPMHVALDHQHLNEVPGLGNPTTENLVVYILERLRTAFRAHENIDFLTVRVSESSTTWAEGRVTI